MDFMNEYVNGQACEPPVRQPVRGSRNLRARRAHRQEPPIERCTGLHARDGGALHRRRVRSLQAGKVAHIDGLHSKLYR